eukprot:12426-Heterococcus_DN1.PRE.1
MLCRAVRGRTPLCKQSLQKLDLVCFVKSFGSQLTYVDDDHRGKGAATAGMIAAVASKSKQQSKCLSS